jgi:Rieske Fe-S protein
MAQPKKPEAPNIRPAQAAKAERSDASPPTDRRNWLIEWGGIVFGTLVSVVPLLIGLVTFLDPWRRRPTLPKSRSQSGGGREGFIRVATLDALQVGRTPQRFPVIASQFDAWNFTPDQPIGAVFLQRVGERDVVCFNATCPHAGCSVSVEDQAFHCPCHNSAFNLDGTKMASNSGRENPSPRNMDREPHTG